MLIKTAIDIIDNFNYIEDFNEYLSSINEYKRYAILERFLQLEMFIKFKYINRTFVNYLFPIALNRLYSEISVNYENWIFIYYCKNFLFLDEIQNLILHNINKQDINYFINSLDFLSIENRNKLSYLCNKQVFTITL